MQYMTVKQLANMAGVNKSTLWSYIYNHKGLKKYMSFDPKKKVRLISPDGVRAILTKYSTKSARKIAVPSTMLTSMILNNQALRDDVDRLHKLLDNQQRIALNAQHENKQLKLNPPKTHGRIWHWLHRSQK